MISLRAVALCLVVGFAGCHAFGIYTAEEKQAMARERARQDEYDRQQQIRYQQYLAQEAQYDRMCLDPQSTYQQNWCVERHRAKERAYAEQRQRAEWAHQEQMQQDRMSFEREQARKEAIRRSFAPPPPKRSIDCTTRPDYAGGSRTTCD